jgi:hypothetical protein
MCAAQVPFARVLPKVIQLQSKRLLPHAEHAAVQLLRLRGYRVAAGASPPECHVTAVSEQLAAHMLRLLRAHSEP